MSVNHLREYFDEFNKYFIGQNVVFLSRIIESQIVDIVNELDRKNELMLNSKAY